MTPFDRRSLKQPGRHESRPYRQGPQGQYPVMRHVSSVLQKQEVECKHVTELDGNMFINIRHDNSNTQIELFDKAANTMMIFNKNQFDSFCDKVNTIRQTRDQLEDEVLIAAAESIGY
jgi:hypothetical protein